MLPRTDSITTPTTGTPTTAGTTKCAVAFRRGLLLGLCATAAFAAMAFWAANAMHSRPPLNIQQASISR